MTEINIKTQKTVLEIVQENNIITIESKSELPPAYKTIISKFVETFEIVSIQEKQTIANKFEQHMNLKL